MSGSGGATGYQSAADHILDAHNMILAGFTQGSLPHHVWDGGEVIGTKPYGYSAGDSYATNPSALRFIIERGLTDVGGNPFDSAVSFDPSDYLDAVQERYDLLATNLDAFDDSTAWSAYLTDALAQDEIVTPTLDVQAIMNTIVTAAMAHALSFVNDAVTKATADRSIVSTVQTAQRSKAMAELTSFASNADTASNASISMVATKANELMDTMATGVQTNGLGDMTATIAGIDTLVKPIVADHIATAKSSGESLTEEIDAGGLEARTGASAFVDGARTNFMANLTALRTNIDPDITTVASTIYTEALGNTSTAIARAWTEAQSLVDSDFLSAAVEAFRTRALSQHVRAVNAFTGGMADINAVNSSAFILGHAMLESDFARDVTAYQVELEKELYMRGFATFMETYVNSQAQYLDVYIKSLNINADLYRSELTIQQQAFTVIFPEYMRIFMLGFTEHLKYSLGMIQTSASETDFSRNLRGQLALELARMHLATSTRFTELTMNEQAQMVAQELGTFMELLKSRLGATVEVMQNEFGETIRSRLTESSLRSNFVQQAVKEQAGIRFQSLDIQRAITALLAEVNRVALVAKSEEAEKDLEYAIKSSGWDLELFQQVGNIISAYSGSVVPNAGKPSRVQTALGGAFAGASLGLELSANPAVAVAGGIAGLIGGYAG